MKKEGFLNLDGKGFGVIGIIYYFCTEEKTIIPFIFRILTII